MMTIPRSTLRDFRALCRKAFGAGRAKELWVHIQAAASQLSLRAANFDVAVELKLTSDADPFTGHAKYELLEACQSSGDDLVTFHAQADGGVRAEWEDRSVPWQRAGEAPPDNLPEFPPLPTDLASNEAGFLQALADAGDCTSGESGRYALGCLQLNGEMGRIAATDGHQLLVQDGFSFPWQTAVLVPVNKGLTARELPRDVPVHIGKAETWVGFVVGNWTISLREHDGKFPRAADCLRGTRESQSHLEIAPADAACAADALPRLPALEEPHRPIIMELNGEARLCARPQDGSPAVAVQLVRSLCEGPAVTISTDRQFLARALALGFTRFGVNGPEATIQAYAPKKQYCWMPLTAIAVNADQQVHVISSLAGLPGKPPHKVSKPVVVPAAAATASALSPPAVKAVSRKRRIAGNPSTVGKQQEPSPLELAMELRSTFRESLAKVNALLGAIKRQRRQSKLVANTLQSLRQLQQAS